LLAGLLLVRVDFRQLVPDRGDQQEHDAAEQKIDEWDERDFRVDGLLSAVTAANVNATHGEPLRLQKMKS
jgi:hypothetical protein